METFLAYWFLVSLPGVLYLGKKWHETHARLISSQNTYTGAVVYWNELLASEKADRLAAQSALRGLENAIKARASGAMPPRPRIRAGYATIRKAVEQHNRQDAELQEARERDTAFVES